MAIKLELLSGIFIFQVLMVSTSNTSQRNILEYDGYDEYDDSGDYSSSRIEELIETIKFKSEPQVIFANVGDSVLLPCEVTSPDVTLIWLKNESELLYQGGFPLSYKRNLNANYEGLYVRVNSTNDFGRYTCKMMISPYYHNPNITHILNPASPPKIHGIYSADNKSVYHTGDTLQLTCNATGGPSPTIYWCKDVNRILRSTGNTLVISGLTTQNSGHYYCYADNEIGQSVNSVITIRVLPKETDAGTSLTSSLYLTCVAVFILSLRTIEQIL